MQISAVFQRLFNRFAQDMDGRVVHAQPPFTTAHLFSLMLSYDDENGPVLGNRLLERAHFRISETVLWCDDVKELRPISHCGYLGVALLGLWCEGCEEGRSLPTVAG